MADGTSSEPRCLSDHVDGQHAAPAFGELGCDLVEVWSTIHAEVIGGH